MPDIIYKRMIPDITQLMALYRDADWKAYLQSSGKLMASFQNSQDVISAWDNDKSVGVIRSVGDKTTILYVQDILVLKQYKRQAIGTNMLRLLLSEYPGIRQVVLLTEDTNETRGSYQSHGFRSCDKGNLVAFVKLS